MRRRVPAPEGSGAGTRPGPAGRISRTRPGQCLWRPAPFPGCNGGIATAVRTADDSRKPLLAGCLAVAGLAAAAFSVGVVGKAGWPEWGSAVGQDVTAVSWLLPGWLVAARRPRSPFGWLLLAGGLFLAVGSAATSYGVAAFVEQWPAAAWTAWVGGWIFFPHLGCQEAVYLLFPSGRPGSRAVRRWLVATVAVNVVTVLMAALSAGPASDRGILARIDAPFHGIGLLGSLFPLVALAQNVVNVAGLAYLYRRRRVAGGTDRRVLTTVFGLGLLDAVVGLLLIVPIGDWIFVLAVPSTMCLTVAIAWGVLRHGLWDIRVIVRRTVTWLLLTGAIVAILAAGVAVVGLVVGGPGGRTLGLVAAAALVTLVVAPLERRLRRAVDRLFFGERLEPYAVLSTIGADLEAAGDPVEALERLVVAIRTSLRVSYAAIELLDRTGERMVAAASGQERPSPLRLPLFHHGAEMGALVVGQDEGDRPFTATDRRLLDDLARQAGAAAGSVALTIALQQSRQRLVTAREEERRRLRRELHDGVASALTAIGLKVDSAGVIASTDGGRAQEVLRAVQGDVAATLAEVRRVVTDLRPPALEDLGLTGALDQLAARFASDRLRVEFSNGGPEDASPLPAAVELALYRIATEAVQNVARHAEARACRIRLSTGTGRVSLTVEDDGIGLAARSSGNGSGLGLAGMAERADELGGTLSVQSPGEGRSGCVVTVTIPTGLAP